MSPTQLQVIKSQLLATQDNVSELENNIPHRIEMDSLVDHEVDTDVDSEEEKNEINDPISQIWTHRKYKFSSMLFFIQNMHKTDTSGRKIIINQQYR